MIDTHAHIDTEAFNEDRDLMLQRAFDSGLEAILIPAIEPKNFDNQLAIIESNERLCGGMGIHPHNALEVNECTLERVEKLCKSKNIVAIGEIGLDYYYDFAPKDVQINAFIEQIRIAKRNNLPVIVHNREADEDVLTLLEKEQDGTLKGVLHCFSSDVKTMEAAVSLGFNISFTGNITFKKTHLVEVVEKTPLERIMLETDSPYIAPVPLRGKRNEPANLLYIAKKISEIKLEPIEEVIKMTSQNAKNLFKILSILLIFFVIPFTSFAQTEVEEYYEDEEEFYNPYTKFIGFGPYFSTNTIVDTYYKNVGEQDISYDGIFTYGGAVSYSPEDYVIVELSYLYSKNKKSKERQELVMGPNIHHTFELAGKWIPNPNSKINFFGVTGVSLILNSFNQGSIREDNSNRFAINTGLGLITNFPIEGAGLFNIVLEWRLNFILGKTDVAYYTKFDQYFPDENISTAPVSSFFSMPRAGIVWYPNF